MKNLFIVLALLFCMIVTLYAYRNNFIFFYKLATFLLIILSSIITISSVLNNKKIAALYSGLIGITSLVMFIIWRHTTI
ncbi:hypothetical protein ACFVR2_06285 [Gottfriedia sp. NPDC057991]|uniref:hypothetical protein n=1 Tax=Gottfriedia sp. NPDC057991 TaxID=3346298 RepID=UPI0036D8E7DE